MGIRGKIYNSLKDFFLKRPYTESSDNGKFSSWQRVTSGVPQGSILGLILLLIFINDLPHDLGCPIKLFADDTNMYMEIKTKEDHNQLQNIFKACDWANKWETMFNTFKCKTLHIGKSVPDNNFVKNMDGVLSKIDKVTNQKDLGIIFDQELNFQQHINAKINLANRNLWIIKKPNFYLYEQNHVPPTIQISEICFFNLDTKV